MSVVMLGVACAPVAAPPQKPAASEPKPTSVAAKSAEQPAPTSPAQALSKPQEKPPEPVSFEGKTIDLYIPFAAGGGYDIRGRIFAEFFQRQVPGNPRVAVQNMPGGGGLAAYRHVMRARPDGLSLLVIPSGLFLQKLLGDEVEGFDIDQPLMLGNYEVPAPSYTVLWVRTELATSWDEIMAKGRQGVNFRHGGVTTGGSQALAAEWLSLVGAPIKVIYGHGGSNEMLAAVDRREIDTFAVDDPAETVEASLPRIQKAFPEWLSVQPRALTPVLALREEVPQSWLAPFGWKSPPHILNALESSAAQKDAYRMAYAVREAVDPLVLPPATASGIYETLRQAMVRVTQDPEYLAAMKQRGFDGGYRSPEELKDTLNKVRTASPEVIQILRKLYAV